MARINKAQSAATAAAHLGRPTTGRRTVNPPVEQGSTVLFPSYDCFRNFGDPWRYCRQGTSTHGALIESLNALEGADHVTLTSSGLEACTLVLLAYARAGGHLLVTDSAYDPTRAFCDQVLAEMGVRTTYFDPLIDAAGLTALIEPETTLILCESPGSLTFEVQDLPAIVAAAGEIPVAVDNTWGAGVFYQPLALGAAISIQALTKYVGGHSDLLMGSIATSPIATAKIKNTTRLMGVNIAASDVALAHRGLRTLHHRLAVHEASGLAVAKWLETHPMVRRVIHPGLESHPRHALWARDFTGASGLFSFIADWDSDDEASTRRFIDALDLHGLGYSWGGYESLCLPAWPAQNRTAIPWTEAGQLLRIHTGLETPADLIDDLASGFDQVRK